MASTSGFPELERRLAALASANLGKGVISRLGLSTVREAKLLVHRKTGNLGRSIHVSAQTETSVTVTASVRYASFLEYGTRPHEITANARKALRFAASAGGQRLSGAPRKGAAVVFAKRVHHPGTPPYPFLGPGAKKAVDTAGLAEAVVRIWNEAA